MKKLAALLSLIAAFAIAVPLAAQAKNGADDPVGHVRHSGTDDGIHHSSKAKKAAKAEAVKAAKPKAAAASTSGRRGSDDAPGDDHGRHGSDDGPNHS
jgi:hypothetical protein